MVLTPPSSQKPQQSQRPSWHTVVMCIVLIGGLSCGYDGWKGISGAVLPTFGEVRPPRASRMLGLWQEGNATKGAELRKRGTPGDGLETSGHPPLVEKTLVIYNVHHDTSLLDNLNGENVEFFLQVGVGGESDRFVDYLFLVPPAPAAVLKSATGRKEFSTPVILPASNVRVLERPQDCLGCSGLQSVLAGMNSTKASGSGDGTIASLPLTAEALLARYAHFVLLDSSVRGPFLPRYMHRPRRRRDRGDRWAAPQATKPWTSVFTDRLTSEVKLVGRSVSCQVELHVQAPVWATDRVGLQLLLERGVLDCITDPTTVQERHELGATRAVLGAGYGVDCLMLRYRGLNLTRVREMELPCTARDDPSVPLLNDGLPINPLEVVFVLATPHLLASDLLLRRYTDYLLGRAGVKENEMYTERGQAVLEARRQRLTRMVSDCGASLDRSHLSSRCPACLPGDSAEEDQKIFIQEFVMAGYDYRFTVAETDVKKLPHHYCEPFVRYQAPDVTL